MTAVRICPVDDNLEATACGDKTVRLWQLYGAASGDESWILEGHKAWVSCLDFSSNGAVLVSGSFDRTFRVWSASSGMCLFTYDDAHDGFILSLAMSFDGTAIVTTSLDESVVVWDVSKSSNIFESAMNELMSSEHALTSVVRANTKHKTSSKDGTDQNSSTLYSKLKSNLSSLNKDSSR